MTIHVEGVSKRFGTFAALDGVTLEIRPGELVALLGPSGSGKTTLLRVIAGLETPDAGRVVVEGEDTTHKRVQERNVGFVFQHYALFRHMTIFENVAFGLRVRPRAQRPGEPVLREKVMALLALVQLEGLAGRYPHQLSGGQRQRIALARALAIEPKVLLLDEPFGALDAKVRRELRRWLRRLHDEIRLTSVFVTHDQDEALEVADRVVVVNHGRIEQEGTPGDVYDHPATPFVHRFLGNVNVVDGAFVRPHDIEVATHASGASLAARLDHAVPLGGLVRLELTREDTRDLVEVELPRDRYEALRIAPGQLVHLAPRRARTYTPSATTPRKPQAA
jgi:sulfate transport system ATP-binding protein